MRRKECIAVLKESPIPTRWMRAYISIYMIALLVVTVYFELRLAISFLSERFDPASAIFMPSVIFVAVGMGFLVCTAFTYKYMTDLRPSGFGWAIAHLIFSAVYWTINATILLALANKSTGYALYAVIFFIVYVGGWAAPNYLYFRKRKELFRAYAPGEIAFAKAQWHSL